jgi:hypothetical protein
MWTWPDRDARAGHGLRHHHFRHGFPRPPFSENAQLVEVTGTATLTNVYDSIAPLDQTHELTLELSNVSGGTVEIATADLLRPG